MRHLRIVRVHGEERIEVEMAEINGHKLVALTKVPVALVDGVVVPDPFEDPEFPEEIVGCDVCDMGIAQIRQGFCCLGEPLQLEDET